MQCPHCLKESKGQVTQSRRDGSTIYRQRMCGLCLKAYYTQETAMPAGTKMPVALQMSSYQRRGEHVDAWTKRPPDVPTIPRGDGAHLQGVWGGAAPKRDDD